MIRRTSLILFLVMSGLVTGFSTPSFAAPTILVMGDSLSANYGIQQHEGWVSLLQQHIKKLGYPHQLINASISGETTSGGATRIEKILKQYDAEIVIIALGANDGLRGLSLKAMRTNLKEMIEKAQKQNARVMLIGMQLPPNYGPTYNNRFYAIFKELSQEHETTLLPFLLKGVGENRILFQKDGLHPNTDAQPKIMQNVWQALEALLHNK